jgi:hypothetical protein
MNEILAGVLISVGLNVGLLLLLLVSTLLEPPEVGQDAVPAKTTGSRQAHQGRVVLRPAVSPRTRFDVRERERAA